jgi:predicted O-methyltransferase YrrM
MKYLKANWIAIVCLVLIVASNVNLGIEFKESSQALGERLDELENSMITLNSGVDDSILPQISPDELKSELGVPPQTEIAPNTFTASFASQEERSVLASISKVSNNMLEIGTGKGGTALLMATYSNPQATVHTIDLPSDFKAISYEQGDSPAHAELAVNSRTQDRYAYDKSQYATKINQIFADSKQFDETKLSGKLDFVFVDGAKTYSYIKNDTQKALKMLKPNGIIVWSNYDIKSPDVVRFVNEISQDRKVYRIKGTNLAISKV